MSTQLNTDTLTQPISIYHLTYIFRPGKLAGKMYKLHKQVGWYFKWFVPVHVGAVGVHALKGQNLLKRIAPL